MFEYKLTPHLSVSFQRYRYPDHGVVYAAPTSLGALPFCAGSEGLTVPSPDGEAIWIGLLTRVAASEPLLVGMLATGADGQRLDAIGGGPAEGTTPLAWLRVPEMRQLLGIAHPADGWWALAREAAFAGAPSCASLTLLARPERPRHAAAVVLPVQLTDSTAFESICHTRVPPLRLDSASGS
ncbi:hypothetical protein ACWF5H_12270 [Arthrobacter sp. NPDC055138]